MDKEEGADDKPGAKDESKLKDEPDAAESIDNEYFTQSTAKVERNDQIERDARILDFVARKVAGKEAIMAWREISLSQAAQVSQKSV